MTFDFTIDKKKRTIEELINIEDIEGKTSLGTSSGADFSHCFYLASKYCKSTENFLQDVNYYHICGKEEALDSEFALTIEFYK